MSFDLRFTLHKLSVFCTVVEAGGVGRAADRLYVSQPVVTAHIRSLEERMGAQLFKRAGRQTRLTPAGEAVYGWARDILTRGRELERELGGLTDGSGGAAVIAASMSIGSYLLPPILTDFHRSRPGAAVSLTVTDPEHALSDASTGVADFAVILADDPPEPSLFEAQALGREELVLVVGEGSELAGREISVEEARDLPFITSPSEHVRRELVDRQLRRAGLFKLNVVIEFGHPEAMKRAVKDGLGVAALFRSAVRDELASRELREASIQGIRLSVPLYLVRRRGKALSPLQEHLMAFVGERIAQEVGVGPISPTVAAI